MIIRKMLNCILIIHAGQLEINPGVARKTSVATIVQVLGDYDYADVFIVYGFKGDDAIAQVLKHNSMAATAKAQGQIDFGTLTPHTVSISSKSEAAEFKQHGYPIIVTP